MIAALLFLALAGADADTLSALEAAKRGDGSSGAPTAGILIEGHADEPPQIITLHRRTAWTAGGGAVSSWKARWMVVEASSKPREIDSWTCPALGTEAEALQRLQPGSLVTPPDSTPPVMAVDAPYYTVWARSRQPGDGFMLTQLSTSSGPVAEWAGAMRRVVDTCLAGQ